MNCLLVKCAVETAFIFITAALQSQVETVQTRATSQQQNTFSVRFDRAYVSTEMSVC